MDGRFAGFFQFCHDQTEGVAALTYSKSPFNVSTFSRFQPFLFQLGSALRRILYWFAQFRAVQMDAVFFAVAEVFAGSEYLVRQYPFRVVTVGFPEVFDRINQRG